MHLFLAFVLVFIFPTTPIVAAPYQAFPSTDPQNSATYIEKANQEAIDINAVPQELALAAPISPHYFSTETISEDEPVTAPGSNSSPDPDSNIVQTDGTSWEISSANTPPQTLIVPETPDFGKCTPHFYGLYSCSKSGPLTRNYGM